MANTTVYGEEWVTKLQERLDHPTNWDQLLNVEYSDTKTLNNPYLSTTPAIQTGTRGTAYGFSDFGETNEARNISTYKVVPIFVDRADLAQSTFSKQMYWSELQAQLVQEHLESAFGAQHANWTDVGDVGGVVTSGNTTQFTVSATNIDDIIRGARRIIRKANGQNLLMRNGLGFNWTPEIFEILESFVQANGFQSADRALVDGINPGIKYLDAYHYVTNDNTANHVFAGVRRMQSLGILRSTYGQVVITQDPALQSGIGIITRVDYGFAWWNNYDAITLDINVA